MPLRGPRRNERILALHRRRQRNERAKRLGAILHNTKPAEPRDIVLDDKAWGTLVSINKWANDNIRPMTDVDHYGMIQWWRNPDDGAGACHGYALLKRRMLMQTGWPRTALLMTIAHEANGDGHAVLTVKTDKSEYILDNLSDKNTALVRDTISLLQTAVASRPQRLGFVG